MKKRKSTYSVFILILLFLGINLLIIHRGNKYLITNLSNIPTHSTLIVLGMYATPNTNEICTILKDRLNKTIKIWNLNKRKNINILVSGNNQLKDKNYDEVAAMRNYLINNGVPSSVIKIDSLGSNTFNSISNAKEKFNIKNCIVVTQEYHIKRVIYIGKNLNMNIYGVTSNMHQYKNIIFYNIMESLARCKDFLLSNLYEYID